MFKAPVKKQITLDDLAAMCMREFTSIREIMATKDDIGRLEGRIGAVEYRLDNIDGRLDNIEVKVIKIEERLERIETVVLKDYTLRIRRLEQTAGI